MNKLRIKSIRQQLLVSLMIALFAGTILVSLVAAYGTLDEIDELFDNQLRQTAEMIQQQEDALHIAHVSGVKGPAYPPGAEKRLRVKGEKQFLIQIWEGDGRLLYSSHPAVAFPDLKTMDASTTTFNGEVWRSYSLLTDDDIVQVSQPIKGRTHLAIEIATKVLWPVLLLFPLLGLFSFLAVRSSLRPLNAVSAAIAQRTPAALDPIEADAVPEEIIPLVGALNGLLVRLGQAFALQRRFTADAAHELRTPLTAIQLQLQVLQRAKTEEERADAEQRLSRGVARCINLVQQLLTFTRVEPDSVVQQKKPVALNALVDAAIDQFAPIAADKIITLIAPRVESITLPGFADNLQILLNNLVDNAIRYTPQGGRVEISLGADAGNTVLSVADNGIGIPPEIGPRVFDRFFRIEGQGTGLGLAIAREIATQHGATLALSAGLDGCGTQMSVTFPAAL